MNILSALGTAVTLVYALVIASYYVLLLVPVRRAATTRRKRSITVIVPAHNEESRIARCVQQLIDEPFDGTKRIIVVDDGSVDGTTKAMRPLLRRGVELLRKKHTGKADSLNVVLRKARTEFIAVVDGDSFIGAGSLQAMVDAADVPGVGAATCVVKVHNNKALLGMWLHIEQLYNTLVRRLFCKLNMNAVTPGPLGVYRRSALLTVGGFSTDGFSEDMDVTIQLVRAGHRVAFVEAAVSSTVMPVSFAGFVRQRTRMLRGMMHILKRHLRPGMRPLDLYTLPLYLFTYVQAVVMGGITLWQLSSGYWAYFASKGMWLGWPVAKFFLQWFSVAGFLRWAYAVFSGAEPLTLLAGLGIGTTLLTYPLFLYAILRFDRSLRLHHLLPLVFMFPYWLLIMVLAIGCLPELFRREQYNKWAKTE